jgi:hypothetical protein
MLFAGDFNNKADPEAIRLVKSILEKNPNEPRITLLLPHDHGTAPTFLGG